MGEPGRAVSPKRGAGVGIAAAGMVYQQAVSFCAGLLIARVIGAAEYGIFNIARSLVNLCLVFTKLGLDVGLQRHLGGAVDTASLRHRIAQLARLRTIAAGAAFVVFMVFALGGASLLEAHVFRFHDFALVLTVSALSLPFLTDMGVVGGAYRGMLRPAPSVVADFIIQPTLRVLFVALLFAAGLRLWGVVIATTASGMVSALYLLWRARRDFAVVPPAKESGDFAERSIAPAHDAVPISAVVKFSGVLAVTMGVTLLTKSLDALALGHYSTPKAVGQYTLAQTMMVLASIFGAAIGQTVGSQIAKRYANQDVMGIQAVMRRQARLTAMVTAPVCAWLAAWGVDLMHIFGPSFGLPVGVLVLLSLSQLATSVLSPSGFALSMTGRHRWELYMQVVGLIVTAVGCVVLVPLYDQVGAAIAAGAGMLTSNCLRIGYIYREMRIHSLDWSILAIIAVAVGLVLVVRGIEGALAANGGILPAILSSAVFMLASASLTWLLIMRAPERAAVLERLSHMRKRLGVAQ